MHEVDMNRAWNYMNHIRKQMGYLPGKTVQGKIYTKREVNSRNVSGPNFIRPTSSTNTNSQLNIDFSS